MLNNSCFLVDLRARMGFILFSSFAFKDIYAAQTKTKYDHANITCASEEHFRPAHPMPLFSRTKLVVD